MQRRQRQAPQQRYDPYIRSTMRSSSLLEGPSSSYPRGPPASATSLPSLAQLGQLGQAAQFAAFLTAAGYDAAYVAAANAAAQALVVQQQHHLLEAEPEHTDELEPGLCFSGPLEAI